MTRTLKTNTRLTTWLLFCLALPLLMTRAGRAQVVTTIPGYTLTASDTFSRADVGPGSSANSNLIGPNWYDLNGNRYTIISHVLTDNTQSGLHDPVLSALYRGSSEAALNTIMRTTSPSGGVSRFRISGGANGYGWFLYGGSSLYITDAVAGSSTQLVSGVTVSGVTAGDVFEWITTSTNSTTTQLTFNAYHSASPTTAYFTKTLTDTTAALQAAGTTGLGAFSGGTWSDFATYTQATTGPVISGVVSASYVAKTLANLSATASSGGSGTLSYQWQRAPGASGGTFTNVSGATSLMLRDTGLTPGGTYRYQLVTADSGGQPSVTSAPMTVTTYPATAWIIGDLGDSITANMGQPNLTTGPTAQVIAALNANGLAVASYYPLNNQGVNGSSTAEWLPSGSLLPAAVAQWKADEVDHVLIMLGTNDAKDGTARSAADYKANLQNIIAYIQAQMPGVVIVLNGPPYNNLSLSGYSPTMLTLLQAYPTQQDALCNGTTIIQGDRSFYALSASNPTYYIGADGTHPAGVGPTALGDAWAAPLVRKYLYSTTPPSSSYLALTLTRNSSGQPALAWIADPAAGGYKILRSADGISYSVIGTAPAAPATGTRTYTDTTATLTQRYYYHVVSTP